MHSKITCISQVAPQDFLIVAVKCLIVLDHFSSVVLYEIKGNKISEIFVLFFLFFYLNTFWKAFSLEDDHSIATPTNLIPA